MNTNEKVGTQSDTTAVTIENTNPHVDGAQARLEELKRMRDQIPRFLIPESSKDATRLNGVAGLPPEFVESTIVAVANQSALVRNGSLTPAQVRERLRYAEAYGPLAVELEALAQFVRFSVNAALGEVGNEALTTYSLARRLVKLREHAGLAPYVAEMRRTLGRARRQSPEVVAKREATKAARAAERAARAAAKVVKPPTAE
jgi:HEPN domain-containing protein